ncbi:MAG: hypothetical protein R3E68_03070 [Burkholderiaceae bacterium]
MTKSAKHALLPLLMLSLSISGQGVAAPALGRVFYTPAERYALDAASRGERPATADPARETGPTATGTIRYSGIVRRSQGPTTGFVDGRPIERGAMGEQDLRIEGDRLVVSGPQGQHHLKPGERLDPGSRARTDGADTRP